LATLLETNDHPAGTDGPTEFVPLKAKLPNNTNWSPACTAPGIPTDGPAECVLACS
jgi:hypothetical protein